MARVPAAAETGRARKLNVGVTVDTTSLQSHIDGIRRRANELVAMLDDMEKELQNLEVTATTVEVEAEPIPEETVPTP